MWTGSLKKSSYRVIVHFLIQNTELSYRYIQSMVIVGGIFLLLYFRSSHTEKESYKYIISVRTQYSCFKYLWVHHFLACCKNIIVSKSIHLRSKTLHSGFHPKYRNSNTKYNVSIWCTNISTNYHFSLVDYSKS